MGLYQLRHLGAFRCGAGCACSDGGSAESRIYNEGGLNHKIRFLTEYHRHVAGAGTPGGLGEALTWGKETVVRH